MKKIFFLMIYLGTLMGVSADSEACKDPEITYSNSGGMLPRGWEISFKKEKVVYKWNNRQIKNEINLQYSPERMNSIVKVLNENQLGKIRSDEGQQIHDRSTTSVKFQCGNKSISASDGYTPVMKSDSDRWHLITRTLEKEKMALLEEAKILVKFSSGRNFIGRYIRLYIENEQEIFNGYPDGRNIVVFRELRLLPGKYIVHSEIFENFDPERKKEIYKDFDPERPSISEGKFSEYLNRLKRKSSELTVEIKKDKMILLDLKNDLLVVDPNFSRETASFESFWPEFRKFVIAKDFKNLEENTSHPLKTRGMMDDDPIHKIPKKDFQKFIHAFSGQPSGLNSSDLNETEAGFVKRSGKIDPKKDQISENDARIGNMVFKKTDGKWKLVLIYFDEAEYEVVRKKGK